MSDSQTINGIKINNLPEIPCGWAWTITTEVCASVRDGTHDTPKYVIDGVPLVTSKNLRNNCIDFSTTKNISLEDHKQISLRSGVERGDILLAMIGTIGNPIVVDTEIEFSIKNVALFKKNESVIKSKYLKLWLESRLLINILENEDFLKGSTQKFIPLKYLRILPVPLPPLNEQRRIVAKLEKLLAKVDTCKERLDKIPGILKRFRQSVLSAACSGRLTADWRENNPDVEPAEELFRKNLKESSSELPLNWYLVSVGDVITSLKYGTSQKCSYDSNGVPVLRIPNVSKGTIDQSDLKYAELSEKEYEELKLFPGDILVIRSNGSVSLVGKSAIIGKADKDFAYAGYLIRLRPNPQLIDPTYLNMVLSSYDVRLQIEIPARSTSGVNNINSQEVKQLKIPVSPLSEQQEIVRRVQHLFKTADQIEQRYQKARTYIDQLIQSILAKAFRGELVPQDPNDEPASVLLERIRAERENRENVAKTAKKPAANKKQRSKKAQPQLEPTPQLQPKPQLEPIQLELLLFE